MEEDQSYEKETQIKELLEEMQAEADEMAFEEHTFMQDELLSDLENDYSFDLHKQQFETVKTKIRQSVQLLRNMQVLEREKDELLKKREQNASESDKAERKQNEIGAMLVQLENEWKEALYAWNGKNKELILEKALLQEFSSFADHYEEDQDFSVIKQKLGDAWILAKEHISLEDAQIKREIEAVTQEAKETQRELLLWENEKEPEPDRPEEVLKNREELAKRNIPYQEFYKLLEFDPSVSDEICNRLEEALLKMGILDALVVEEAYKDTVLSIDEGGCDRYLFTTQKRADHSLLDLLSLASDDDIFMNQRLGSILGSISWQESNENAQAAINSNGVYKIGPVVGTITKTYTAQYIGMKARERNRKKKIEECKAMLADLEIQKVLLEEKKAVLEERKDQLTAEYQAFPKDADMRESFKMLELGKRELERLQSEALRIEEQRKKLAEQLGEKKKEVLVLAQGLYLDCNLDVFERAEEAAFSYTTDFGKLVSVHELYRNSVQSLQLLEENLEIQEADLDELRFDVDRENSNLAKISQELDSIRKQLELTDYNQIKERLDQCLSWLNEYLKKMQACVTEKTQKQEEAKRLEEQIQNDEIYAKELEQKVSWLTECFESERDLGYLSFAKQEEKLDSAQIVSLLAGAGRQNRDTLVKNLNQVLFENKAYLSEYDVDQTTLFEKLDETAPQVSIHASRADLTAKFNSVQIPFIKLPGYLAEEIEEQSALLKDEDKSLFQDILANTMGRKIRAKINSSNAWVEKMNALMNAMNTSSGLKLSLRWKSKTAEKEEQLDTNELVELLKREAHLLNPKDFEKLSKHFRSKVEQARRNANDSAGVSFYQVMKDTLDYRKWFEFQLFSQKNNERRKELTNSVFGTFSGGEKAMSMYVPLFSAVVAKYQGGRTDAPRLISLDEAFAGVDSRNIRDMFRLMSKFEFDFIINSQVLWGDSDTLDALAIYQLIRPENAKFVSVMPYLWNGHVKKLLENEEEVELEGAELTSIRE